MLILDPAPLIETVVEAARLTGARVLFGGGWTELAAADVGLPDYVRLVGDVDHDWLFPRCRAVIHHGGMGTTGAGLTAGRPTWIYSLWYDQPFWGKRMMRLGVGGHTGSAPSAPARWRRSSRGLPARTSGSGPAR